MTTFIHQLTSGLAGWLTFEQMRKGTENLCEPDFGKPIEQIAQGRSFEVKREFHLPKAPSGGIPRIDFLLVNRKERLVIALETKYKKTEKDMKGSLSDDAARLHELSLDTINNQIALGKGGRTICDAVSGFTLVRSVLIVWQEQDIIAQISIEEAPIQKQFYKLLDYLLPNGMASTESNYSKAMRGKIPTRPVARTSGSLRPGSTKTSKRFWVASLLHQSAWSKIRPPSADSRT